MKKLKVWFFLVPIIMLVNSHAIADEYDRCYDRTYRAFKCMTIKMMVSSYECDPEDNISPSNECMKTKAYQQGSHDGTAAGMNIAKKMLGR